MMELVKFEVIKIFKNKGIYIAALAIFIFITGIKAIRCISFKGSLVTKEEVQEIAANYMSDSYSKNDIEELWRKSYDTEEPSKERYFLNVYYGCFRKNDGNEIADKFRSINNDIKELEDMGKTDEFRYKSLINQRGMLEKLQEKESIYLGDWSNVLNFNLLASMKLVLLVLGLAGIFSEEYSSRVSYLNLSSKNGKTKLNFSKLIAVLMYSTIVFIFVTVCSILSTMYLGLPNGDKPLSFYSNSIYNITINEYYLGSLAFSYLGTLIFGIITMLISLLTKNVVAAFILPVVLELFPKLVTFQGTFGYVFEHINFTQLFNGGYILNMYTDFDIFGQIVLFPYVIGVVGVISIVVILIFYKNFSRKQKIA